MRIEGDRGQKLEVVADADFRDLTEGRMGQKAIIVALAASEAMALVVEGHAGNEGKVDSGIIGKERAGWLGDSVGLGHDKIVGASEEAQLHICVIYDTRQDTLTTHGLDVSERRHFVGKRCVEQNRLRRVGSADGVGQLCKRGTRCCDDVLREPSFFLSYRFSYLLLCHFLGMFRPWRLFQVPW